MSADVQSSGRIYEKRSVMKSSLERLVGFHEDPNVFSRLAPPPIFIQVRQDNRTSLTTGDLHFTLWFGPLPVRWHARHQPGLTPSSFVDVMVSGPLASWHHEHIFSSVPGGVELLDRVTFSHKNGLAGLFTRLFFDGLPLRILFFYRHLRTRMAIERG